MTLEKVVFWDHLRIIDTPDDVIEKYVATDLEPRADDFEQVLRTPWIKVVELKAG